MGFSRANHVKAIYLQEQTDKFCRLGKSSRCSPGPKLSKLADRATRPAGGVTWFSNVLMLSFWAFLSLDVCAKPGGKPCWPSWYHWFLHCSASVCPCYDLFSIFLNNSHDEIGFLSTQPTPSQPGLQRESGSETNAQKQTVRVVWEKSGIQCGKRKI